MIWSSKSPLYLLKYLRLRIYKIYAINYVLWQTIKYRFSPKLKAPGCVWYHTRLPEEVGRVLFRKFHSFTLFHSFGTKFGNNVQEWRENNNKLIKGQEAKGAVINKLGILPEVTIFHQNVGRRSFRIFFSSSILF
jgi:hypothetical protein